VNLKREHQCRPSTYPSSRQTELWNEVQAALERMLGLSAYTQVEKFRTNRLSWREDGGR
jgi:hypothetical protein